MATEEEIFDDIGTRIAALEFMVRQILSRQFRSMDGDPLEKAVAEQIAAGAMMREKIDAMPDGPERSRTHQLSVHITRIYEDLIRGLEEDEP